MLLVRNIRLPLTCPDPDAEAAAKALAILRVPARKAAHCGVAKLSVDARHGTPVLVYTIAVTLKDEGEESALAGASPCVCYTQPPKFDFTTGKTPLAHRPVVVGLGPAGLFAALLLARRGYRPLVLERGPALDERIRAVEHFEKTGTLDPNANIQFGEGGAGTFSDGKLTTRVGDPLCAFVTGAFLDHGAPADIAWRQKPHVGTDLLRGVIRSIRGEIKALGGEVRFNTALTGLHTRNGALIGIETTAGRVPCEQMILAVGHSARDTFAMLHGLRSAAGMQAVLRRLPRRAPADRDRQKPLPRRGRSPGAAEGGVPAEPARLRRTVRLHLLHVPGRHGLRRRQRGRRRCHQRHEPARPRWPQRQRGGGRQCGRQRLRQRPGEGRRVPASAGAGRLPRGRRELPAPAETVGSFLAGRGALELGAVQPTYPRGETPCDLGSLLPDDLSGALREGLTAFGRKLAAYRAPDAVLTGLETRTSSPVRLLRDKENLQCTGLAGLYPCGEGAGYAGGIMTAAVDGVRCAAELMKNWGPMAD